MKITVVGGGNSAQTMACDLALLGHEATLFDLPEFQHMIAAPMRTRTLEKYGSIGVTGLTGLAHLADATTDADSALARAEVVLVAVPAYAHDRMFEVLAPRLRPGMAVVMIPGNWGAYRLRRHLNRTGLGRGVMIAETDVCMHICRAAEPFLGPGKVRVVAERSSVRLAAVPASDTARVLEMLAPVYPILRAASSVVETGLYNGNIITHGPLVLMNAGWLEFTSGNFMIYRDGLTESVGRVVDTIARERNAVASALGMPDVPPPNTYEKNRNAQWVHDPCEIGPPNLGHRYISEDVPFGLVPVSDLAAALGVATPVTDAMIAVAGAANGVDYRTQGLTLKALGLPPGPAPAILEAVDRAA